MTLSFSVHTPQGSKQFQIDPGSSLYFVGANGGGKSRLAVSIEAQLGERCHRISAHRALSLNPSAPKLSEAAALRGLRFGNVHEQWNVNNRTNSRWNNKAAVSLLNDYDFLVQALFAEQSNTSLKTHVKARAGNNDPAPPTKFEKLVEIWDRILPHRTLHITGDDINVSVTGKPETYPAPEMSDGERAVFYLIGQTLVADQDSLIIFDEPELHVHRSIVARLWDELEAARPDCGMVIISHDLDFVASREGQKYVLREYSPNAGWTIEAVPDDTGFTEETATLILGSRKPVLFVEGAGTSLDQAIYRACFPNWTIIPRGSCEEVIHAVVTMRANASLTRVTCAGIVDADAYDPAEVSYLRSKGVEVLPVSEIENLLIIPDVVDAILTGEGHARNDIIARRSQILDELFRHAEDAANQNASVMRYCRRRIDRTLKKLDLSSAPDVSSLASEYARRTNALDITELASTARTAIQRAITSKDANELLKWYDNKGVLSIACKAKGTTKQGFEQWIVRALRNGSAPAVSNALRTSLPLVQPS